MKHIVYPSEADEFIGRWVADKLGMVGDWGRFKAFGVLKDSELIAGIIFNNYTFTDISMHVASDEKKKWLSKHLLFELFYYAFEVCKCNRVTGYVEASKEDVLAFDKKIGFVQEGVKRKGCINGDDVIVLGMLREECRFLDLKRVSNEKDNRLAA
jgi:RimJ/RimL family protein N-acetyltransferase